MTLQEVIDGAVQEWWGPGTGARVRSGVSGLADKLELAVRDWMDEQDCRLDQIVALVEADLNPCLRKGVFGRKKRRLLLGGGEQVDPGWNLQLSPEAGHLIDFSGATLEDVLQEACNKYLPKEATT